jgi:hypothetical protein
VLILQGIEYINSLIPKKMLKKHIKEIFEKLILSMNVSPRVLEMLEKCKVS